MKQIIIVLSSILVMSCTSGSSGASSQNSTTTLSNGSTASIAKESIIVPAGSDISLPVNFSAGKSSLNLLLKNINDQSSGLKLSYTHPSIHLDELNRKVRLHVNAINTRTGTYTFPLTVKDGSNTVTIATIKINVLPKCSLSQAGKAENTQLTLIDPVVALGETKTIGLYAVYPTANGSCIQEVSSDQLVWNIEDNSVIDVANGVISTNRTGHTKIAVAYKGAKSLTNSLSNMLKTTSSDDSTTVTVAPAGLASGVETQMINNLLPNIATSSSDFSQATNFSGNNTIVGSVIAGGYSPNVESENSATPANNYMYTWTRDTAITMNEIAYLFNNAVTNSNQSDINKYGQYLLNYVNWLNTVDANSSFSPGIAKSYVNGVPDTNWNWPQTDGPALVAITLINFADTLLDNNVTINGTSYGQQYVLDNLYDPTLNQDQWGIIKYNLQYVASNIATSGYDIWESIWGTFFFNQLVQDKALALGSAFANRMQDTGAGQYYLQTAYNNFSGSYFNNNYYKQYSYNGAVQGYTYFEGLGAPGNVDPTSPDINASNFNNYRGMGLDISALLGILYARFTPEETDLVNQYIPESSQTAYLNPVLSAMPSPTSTQTANTIQMLIQAFAANTGMDPYPINAGLPTGVSALGRYPGDLYSGAYWNNPSYPANAWFISTIALAQYYYLTGQADLGNEVITDSVASHWNQSNYTMNEQFDRTTGYMTSFQNLSWSYAMYLMTYRVYQEVNGN